MFLKKGKTKSPFSITAKLTVLYGISTISLLAIVCMSSYLALSEIIFRGNETFLTDEMNMIKTAIIEKPNDLKTLRLQTIDIPQALNGSVYRFFVRISDERNHEIISTPSSNTIFVNKNKSNSYWTKSKDNENFLVLQEIVRLPKTQQTRLIQIALNVSYQYQLISDYRNKEYLKLIVGTLILSALAAIFLGYIVARRGLKQLFTLANTSKNITTTSLNQRLDLQNLPKELILVGQAFNQMLDRIEYGYAKLSQFSAELAHELRTPINNLMMQTEIILSKQINLTEYKKVLESNLEEFQQISHIIENILFLARSQNNLSGLTKTTINIHQEITAIKDFFQIMADEKNIKITCEGTGTMQANQIMFRRMISNLLSNAVNSCRQNDSIYFNIKNTNDNSLQISISDTGIGISPDHLPNIGNRFYRVQDETVKTKTKGIGLGLAIVKSIVEIHKGTFEIFSEINQGTQVVLTFPHG